MPSRPAQLTSLFYHELELCGLSPGESVIVLNQAQSRDGYVEALLNASEMMGADALPIQLPGIKSPTYPYGGGPDHISDLDGLFDRHSYLVDALASADMVLDVTPYGLTHSKARQAILEGGARMLTIKEPPNILQRLFPRQSLRERVERAEDLLLSSSSMRVTSRAGTDITMDLGDSTPVISQYGYTDEDGRWDHFAGGFVACYPVDDSPNGRIVIDTGDFLIPQKRYVDHPIEVRIQDGYVTHIEGDGVDAAILARYYEMWDDEEAFATSHFGFGVDDAAVWEAQAFADAQDMVGQDNRAYAGNFMWSTGPNRYVDRQVKAHIDVPMRSCSLYLDGELIIEDGDIVEESLVSPQTE